MVVVVAAACFAVAVLLGLWSRARSRIDDLETELATTDAARRQALTDVAAARSEADDAHRARDDAAERVQRARRDAAEVGARLAAEAAARAEADQRRAEADDARAQAEQATAEAEQRRSEAEQRCAEAERHRDDADQARAQAEAQLAQTETRLAHIEGRRVEGTATPETVVAAEVETSTAAVLWQLALARAERTWRTSIALGFEDGSPLAASADALRTAVEIEVDAAREEAGAGIDLDWTFVAPAPPEAALVVLGVIESVVQSVAKTASMTTIGVQEGPDAVEVAFSSVDDAGDPVALDLPAGLVAGPGAIRVGW